MQLQQKISHENLEKNIGKTFEVLIEGITKNKKYYVARSYMDTPEIDGVIYVENTKKIEIGNFISCQIIDVKDYDLIGKI